MAIAYIRETFMGQLNYLCIPEGSPIFLPTNIVMMKTLVLDLITIRSIAGNNLILSSFSQPIPYWKLQESV
jgi:hypothetical protein